MAVRYKIRMQRIIDILNVWYNNIVMISYPVLALFIVKNEIEIIVLFYALDFE